MRGGIPPNGDDPQPQGSYTTVHSQATRRVPRPKSSRSAASLCGPLSRPPRGKRSAMTNTQDSRGICDGRSVKAESAWDFPQTAGNFPAVLRAPRLVVCFIPTTRARGGKSLQSPRMSHERGSQAHANRRDSRRPELEFRQHDGANHRGFETTRPRLHESASQNTRSE
jgi:hypothetical protein